MLIIGFKNKLISPCLLAAKQSIKFVYLWIILLAACARPAVADGRDEAVSLLLDKIEPALICNSKTGGTISDVKITSIVELNNRENVKYKVAGVYVQQAAVTAKLKFLETNGFSTLSGIFEIMVTENLDLVEGRWKIGLGKGGIKKECLIPNEQGWSF